MAMDYHIARRIGNSLPSSETNNQVGKAAGSKLLRAGRCGVLYERPMSSRGLLKSDDDVGKVGTHPGRGRWARAARAPCARRARAGTGV